MDWFLHDNGLRHERANLETTEHEISNPTIKNMLEINKQMTITKLAIKTVMRAPA